MLVCVVSQPLTALNAKTGSGRGIGREMALELGRRGAKVIVNYANSQESAEEVVQAIKKSGSDAASIKANVSDVDQIVRMFEEAVGIFGQLNIVCSNSGVVSFGHVKDVTPEEFDRVFNINTRGQFFVAREAYKHLEVGGRLILMGSITGQAKGVPKHAVYSGSKGTIETFVRCMAIGEPWPFLLSDVCAKCNPRGSFLVLHPKVHDCRPLLHAGRRGWVTGACSGHDSQTSPTQSPCTVPTPSVTLLLGLHTTCAEPILIRSGVAQTSVTRRSLSMLSRPAASRRTCTTPSAGSTSPTAPT